MRTVKINSVNNFAIEQTAVLATVIMLNLV